MGSSAHLVGRLQPKHLEAFQVQLESLKKRHSFKKTITPPLGYLDFIIKPFNKTTVPPGLKIVANA